MAIGHWEEGEVLGNLKKRREVEVEGEEVGNLKKQREGEGEEVGEGEGLLHHHHHLCWVLTGQEAVGHPCCAVGSTVVGEGAGCV